jgi:hypothetical protein
MKGKMFGLLEGVGTFLFLGFTWVIKKHKTRSVISVKSRDTIYNDRRHEKA